MSILGGTIMDLHNKTQKPETEVCLDIALGNVTETTAPEVVFSESKNKMEERLMSNSKVDVTSDKEDI